MKRELKVKELHLLDAARRRFLKHQQEVKASQIQQLDQEIGRKVQPEMIYCTEMALNNPVPCQRNDINVFNTDGSA